MTKLDADLPHPGRRHRGDTRAGRAARGHAADAGGNTMDRRWNGRTAFVRKPG